MKRDNNEMPNKNMTLLDRLHFLKKNPTTTQKQLPCVTYKIMFCSGVGLLTGYPVFPGAELILNEYKGTAFDFNHDPMDQVMQINFCLEGRMGWTLHNGDCLYLGAGDISIHMMDHCATSSMALPLEYYKGFTIFLDLDEFKNHLPQALCSIGYNPIELKSKFCDAGQITVLPATTKMDTLFYLWDTVPSAYQLSYLQLKLQELLLFLNIYDLSKSKGKDPYPAAIISTIKKMHKKLTSDLKEHPTIELLSKDFLINTSTLKKAFKSIYGQPIAQYMKDYRMHHAANLLCQTTMTVGEISEMMGYESQSKFATAFKKIMQIPPVEYRTRYKMENTDLPKT
ncbi:helix-turn-helix domain-containing protein [Clostridium estertheticum]|nr:AraC family transcriptional regulator [Clostridium estertheticum]MBZ9616737.1 AraC family transcriptional regulator [Clostridium estertheticum subsp. laramiense]WAG72447.1 AraC family transcriptional regulator [Clostridium estertheticum]